MVICETYLRNLVYKGADRLVVVRPGDVITPAARDFMREHGFSTKSVADSCREMSWTKLPPKGAGRYRDLLGNVYAEKPEHMTYLRGNVLVEKNHPRIRFRGKLDTLQAFVVNAQILVREEGMTGFDSDLGEILSYIREILASEVKDEAFTRATLLGLDESGLRSASHNPHLHYGVGHLVPDAEMGKCFATLNTLRALSREAELAGIDAFMSPDGTIERPDLVLALNRLSSGIYLLICKLHKLHGRRLDNGKR